MAKTFDPTQALAEVLTEHGPLDGDDLARRLRSAGVPDPGTIPDEIECPVGQLADNRWVWLPSLLAGRVFTHRVAADEVDHDILITTPDLDPITELCNHDPYRQLADGSAIQTLVPDFDDELRDELDIPLDLVDEGGVLSLAPGTLGALGVAEGDLVGVRLTPAGLTVEQVTTPAETPVGTQLTELLGADEPEDFAIAVWTVCAADSAAFTDPVPPLSEIADDHGLLHRGGWLAPAGFDFAQWDLERECTGLAIRYDLDEDDAFALNTLIRLYRQTLELVLASTDAGEPPEDTAVTVFGDPPQTDYGRSTDLIRTLGGALADPVLAEVLAAETADDGPFGAAALGLLAEALEPQAPPSARVACRWLRSVALVRTGDITAAEHELLAAESMDMDWPPVLLDLARIASDRGDAEGGLALLHRAGAGPEHPLTELLQRHRSEPRTGLGRNDPCWCGSGRKYKKCHLGHEELALPDRAGWLYQKAIQHVLLTDWLDELTEVGYQRCRYADADDYADDEEALTDAMGDPLVIDAVLAESGAFEDFLAVRGPLLPDDERALADQWLLVDRSVFEVEHVDRGRQVTVRDLRTGDRHEVRERKASQQLQPGQLVCARVLPDGVSMRFFALEPVSPADRDGLIELLDAEPEAAELVAHSTATRELR